LNYQPSSKLYATLSYSFIDATTTAGFQSDGGVGLFYASKSGEGQASGLPKSQINGLISYSLGHGWGISSNFLVTSTINNNFAATLEIPWQYEIDASVTYHTKKWDYRLSVGNVTDAENWAPPNAVYGNASILALAGTTVSFTAKFNF